MRVFLSHNSQDKDAVRIIRDRLKSEAIDGWLDEQRLLPGAPIADDVASGLEKCDACAVFFGPSGLGPWHREEIRVVIDRAARARDDFRAIPVLLPGADPKAISVFLRQRIWVDFRSGLDDAVAFGRLVAGIKGEASRLDDEFKLEPPEPPYRGLERFEKEQAEFFFGRDADIRKMVERLRTQPFLAVIGASGSGKSSLARAGLSSTVARDAWPDLAAWKVITVFPGADPLRSLAVKLAADLPLGDRLARIDEWTARFQQEPAGLRHVLDALFPDSHQRVLFLIDQFEELFTHGIPQDEAVREGQAPRRHPHGVPFIANLADAVAHARDRLRILITLRADFVPQCLESPEMVRLLEYPQLPLGALSREALREVVVLPARRVGAFFEKGLVEAILKEADNQPGALPLLQHALKELWHARKGPWLTHEAYQQTGGVEGALQRSADATFAALRAGDEQGIARSIFLRLTSLGEGVSDTRRRVALDELYPSRVDRALVDRVIATLSGADSRLIVVNEDRTVEVTHEALIQRWQTLKGWLDANREQTRQLRELTHAAAAWLENGRDPSYLYRGGRLEDAGRLAVDPNANLTPLEHEFVEASVRQRQDEISGLQRKARIQRHLLQVVGALLFLAAGVAWFAKMQRDEARQQRGEAQQQRTEAQQQRDEATRNLRLSKALSFARNARDAVDDQSVVYPVVPGALWATESLKTVWTEAGTNEWARCASRLPPPPLASHQAHSDEILAVQYAPGGGSYASLSKQAELVVWSAAHTETVRTELPGSPPYQGTGLAFSPEGKWLAVNARREAWILATSDWSRRTNLSLGMRIKCLAFSFDGGLLAMSCDDTPAAIIYETTNWSRLHVIDNVGTRGDLAFGPDPAWLFSGDKVWKLSTQEASPVPPLSSGGFKVLFITRTPPHKLAVERVEDGRLKFWQCTPNAALPGGLEFSDVVDDQNWEDLLAIPRLRTSDPAGECVVLYTEDQSFVSFMVVDVQHLRCYKDLPLPSTIRVATYRAEQGHLLTGSQSGALALWNLRDMDRDRGTHVLRLHFDTNATQFAFSPWDSSESPQWLATGWADGTLRIHRAPGWKNVTNLIVGDVVDHLAFMPTEHLLLVKARAGTNRSLLHVFSTENWASQQTIPLADEDRRIEFSPMGKWVAAVAGPSLKVFRPRDLGEVAHRAFSNNVQTVSFNASEDLLCVTAALSVETRSGGRLLRRDTTVLEIATGKDLAWQSWAAESGSTNGGGDQLLLEEAEKWPIASPFPLRTPHLASVPSAKVPTAPGTTRPAGPLPRDDHRFSADGRWLVDHEEGDVLVFPRWPEDMIALACARLPRNLTTNEWAERMGTEPYCATCTNLTDRARY